MLWLKKLFFIGCAVACLSAAAYGEEPYETVTSITTYSTRAGVQREAIPAFVIRSDAGTLPGGAQARLIERLRSGDDSHLQTQIWKGQQVTLRRDPSAHVTPEEEFAFAKTSGALFIGAFFAPEVGIAYAAGAAMVGLFSPFEKIIDQESDKDALFARVALVDRAGKIVRAHYRAMASDRSGAMQAVYYMRRHLATPRSSSFVGSYLIGEVVSSLAGGAVKMHVPKAGVLGEELAGQFLGSTAESRFRAASTSGPASDAQGGYMTMMVPDGFGGWRIMSLPKPSLAPSLPAATLAPAPQLQVFGVNDVPPFAIEAAVTTFRSAGASVVRAEEIAPDVVLVTPDYFTEQPALNSAGAGDGSQDAQSDPDPVVDDHSIDNLPRSIEIHGLGSFSISR